MIGVPPILVLVEPSTGRDIISSTPRGTLCIAPLSQLATEPCSSTNRPCRSVLQQSCHSMVIESCRQHCRLDANPQCTRKASAPGGRWPSELPSRSSVRGFARNMGERPGTCAGKTPSTSRAPSIWTPIAATGLLVHSPMFVRKPRGGGGLHQLGPACTDRLKPTASGWPWTTPASPVRSEPAEHPRPAAAAY
jgi:hypothetical protein